MSEIDDKLKEANDLADKELLKLYFDQKIFGIKTKYVYIAAVACIFLGFVL